MNNSGLSFVAIIFLLILWLIFGLISSTMMHNRGRSEAAGWLLGLLFGPVGLLIILLVSDSAEKIAEKQQELAARSYAGMRKCPYCQNSFRLRPSSASTAAAI